MMMMMVAGPLSHCRNTTKLRSIATFSLAESPTAAATMMQVSGLDHKEDNESSKRILFTYPMIKQGSDSRRGSRSGSQKILWICISRRICFLQHPYNTNQNWNNADEHKCNCHHQTDMNEDMRAEVLEMCVNACEKHTSNNENAAKMIKEQLDKRYITTLVS